MQYAKRLSPPRGGDKFPPLRKVIRPKYKPPSFWRLGGIINRTDRRSMGQENHRARSRLALAKAMRCGFTQF